jgi:tripartite-type tricarboxylate transporter receptor subunit TctC
MTNRLTRRTFGGAALGMLAAPAIGRAQTKFPDRPITMIVPYAAGGGADIVARQLALQLGEQLKQQVIVDNRGGAAGGIGTDMVARAKPDGYTLLFAVSSNIVINPHVQPQLKTDTLNDLVGVAQVTNYQYVIVINPETPAKTLAEFVALAKQNPGKFTFSSSGAGGSNHLGAELLKSMAGIDMLHIPFKGTAPALMEVMNGRITMNVSSLPPATAQVKAGKLRALAATGPTRIGSLPDVPTVRESGIPELKDYSLIAWHGVFAPAKTPPEIVDLLAREIAASRKDSRMIKRLETDGLESASAERAAFVEAVKQEHAFWGVQLKKLDVKFE